MRFWVDLEDSSGNKLGPGPIYTAQSWGSVARLDRAGTFQFAMPASDHRAQYVTAKRVARCRGLVNGAVTDLGAGIIDQITVQVGNDGRMELAISGDDLLRELTYRTVGDLEIGTEASPATTGPADISAYFPSGWTLDTVNGYNATAKSIWHLFEGESVLAALIKLAELSGEHFRLGSGRSLIWMQDDLDDSGLRAVQGGEPYSLGLNDDICLILSLEQEQDSFEMASRVIPFGAGEGEAKILLTGTTWTPPSGYTLDAANNWIRRDATETAYGQIEAPQSFKDIKNADMLAEQAYEWLRTHSSAEKFYRAQVTKLDGTLPVGETLRVVYHRWVDGYHAVNIDADLRVLEATTQVDNAGLRTVGLQLATIDRYPNTDADALIGGMSQAANYYTHAQPLNGADITGTVPGTLMDITGLTETTDLETDADYLPLYDDSAAANRKVTLGRLGGMGQALAMFQALPNLRGFWPMSSIDENGDAYDLGGQARKLTNTNAVTFGVDGLAAYASFAGGSSQYFTRADEAGLDITGALTFGMWIMFTTLASAVQPGGKWYATTNQRAYTLLKNASDQAMFYVSSDGTSGTVVNVTGGTVAANNLWYFLVGRFTPSTELAVFLNNAKVANTTSIPASVFNSSEPFDLGRSNRAAYISGRVSLAFICAAALSDALLGELYERSRRLFGV